MVQIPKSQEIFVKFTIAECSNFDKRCSNAHFVPFLFYYYCTDKLFFDMIKSIIERLDKEKLSASINVNNFNVSIKGSVRLNSGFVVGS